MNTPSSVSSPTSQDSLSASQALEVSKARSDAIVLLETSQKQSHPIVYAIVENRRGVLHKVSNMFRAKGFNITSIAIGSTSHPELARMTIVPSSGDDASLNLLVKQLRRMIDVVEVGTMTRYESIARELALVRFATPTSSARREILDLSNHLGAKNVELSQESLVVEFCSTPERIDFFIEEASKSGAVKEVVRTGLTALRRE